MISQLSKQHRIISNCQYKDGRFDGLIKDLLLKPEIENEFRQQQLNKYNKQKKETEILENFNTGIDSLENLKKHRMNMLNRSSEELVGTRKKGPKMVVCHDMQGGYKEDNMNFKIEQQNGMNYRFNHWPITDIFIYFSHHLVTVPPKNYIEIGHRMGS